MTKHIMAAKTAKLIITPTPVAKPSDANVPSAGHAKTFGLVIISK